MTIAKVSRSSMIDQADRYWPGFRERLLWVQAV